MSFPARAELFRTDVFVLAEPEIARARLAMGGGRREVQVVLPQQLPEGAPVFAGRFRRARDVALMLGKETLEIGFFKIWDDAAR